MNNSEHLITMENLYIAKCNFEREPSLKGGKIETKLSIRHDENAEINMHRFTLQLDLSDEQNLMKLSLDMVGVFRTAIDLSNDENKKMFRSNIISIMFPYIRSYVSLVTTQPGMAPVVLPIFNVNNLMDEADKNQS